MLSLWQMSLSAGALILLTALLRLVAGTRLPRRMYVALWDIALLCGLIPFRIPRPSIIDRVTDGVAAVRSALPDVPLRVLSTHDAVLETVAVSAAPASPAVNDIQNGLTQAARTAHEAVRSAPGWLWQATIAVWAIGAVILAAVLLTRWLLCHRAFTEALPCEDPRAIAFLRANLLHRHVRVRVSGRVSSPLSYGLMRPVILLPISLRDADDQTLAYVLTHELMHIRAWDMLRKTALLFALCLHWPNPLFWLMARLHTRDMELMCDERVVRRLGGRKAYCLTLLDMEVRRSNLTMGTCFSVTGIEERIKVMKNRKHQGILSIALAFAIFLGATVGAMTGVPLASADNASPHLFFSHDTWENNYAKYEPYGLGYDAKNGVITYKGQVVRYFEDMWPVDEQGKAGACFQYEGGTIDVYGVREFPEFIQRNPDGSFDPSGTLIGLREATQEEYDEHTARMKVFSLNQNGVTEYMNGYQVVDAAILIPGAGDQLAIVKPSDVEWWTAEEYRAWLDAERIAIQELVSEQARAWTPSTGWFTWTQEKADEVIARYESVLRDIEKGALVSKRINGEDANMTLVQELGETTFSTATSVGIIDAIPSVDSLLDDADTLASETIVFGFSVPDGTSSIVYAQEPDLGSAQESVTFLIKVSPDDESKFSPEDWARILELIDLGVIEWETDAAVTKELHDVSARLDSWRETIEPYRHFGLSFGLDSTTDIVHLYWNGQEVRGLFDPQVGTWITDHTGLGHYPDGAKELIAVYENGVLTGLREADAEESAVWDKLRRENMHH